MIKDMNMTVKDLKSYILILTKSKPFILRFDIDSTKTVQELIEMQKDYFN